MGTEGEGLCDESPAQIFVGQQQDGNVQQEIQDTGYIIGAEIHAQIVGSQRAQQLAHTHEAAGVQVQGYDKQVQCGGGDQLADHSHHEPQAAVMQRVVKHGVSSCRSVVRNLIIRAV